MKGGTECLIYPVTYEMSIDCYKVTRSARVRTPNTHSIPMIFKKKLILHTYISPPTTIITTSNPRRIDYDTPYPSALPPLTDHLSLLQPHTDYDTRYLALATS